MALCVSFSCSIDFIELLNSDGMLGVRYRVYYRESELCTSSRRTRMYRGAEKSVPAARAKTVRENLVTLIVNKLPSVKSGRNDRYVSYLQNCVGFIS